jgi:hypothetical protein
MFPSCIILRELMFAERSLSLPMNALIPLIVNDGARTSSFQQTGSKRKMHVQPRGSLCRNPTVPSTQDPIRVDERQELSSELRYAREHQLFDPIGGKNLWHDDPGPAIVGMGNRWSRQDAISSVRHISRSN